MWIARDKDGTLNLYDGKPFRGTEYQWWMYSGNYSEINKESDSLLGEIIFKDLKWDDEPLEVELVKKGKS